ncbi:MAG: phosphatidylserine decarboxylase [Bauldia sp.]|nr:phosphatidylserine decarboxylase [Bauldia sp.]
MDAAAPTPPAFPSIRREAYPLIAWLGFLALVLAWLWTPLFWLGLAATLLAIYAFRDPERIAPADAAAVLSPADGRVKSVDRAVPPAELQLGSDKRIRIALAVGPFDVRVNRAPIAGTVAQLVHRPRSRARPARGETRADVEQNALAIVSGRSSIGVVQNGGVVPRSIRSLVAEGDAVTAGQRFGLLAFGSEVDLYLPADAAVTVVAGQTALAGETILARLAK